MSSFETVNVYGRSNPRRRQRNASEDSGATRQPVKRRKRTTLTQDTYEQPEARKLNGHISPITEAPQGNGHVKFSRQKSVDNTGLAIRGGGAKKAVTERRSGRNDGHIELV